MQSRDPFLPELGHLDSVGRLKIFASLQKVFVHIFIHCKCFDHKNYGF